MRVEIWLNDCAAARFEPGAHAGPAMGLATEDGDGLPEEDALQVIVDRGPILLRAREGHAPNSAKTEGGVRVFCPSS